MGQNKELIGIKKELKSLKREHRLTLALVILESLYFIFSKYSPMSPLFWGEAGFVSTFIIQ